MIDAKETYLNMKSTIIKITNDNKKDKGINFIKIPVIFRIENWKYVSTGYPFSTIKSKKFTALTVQAINDRPNKIIKNVLIISLI